MKRPAMANTTSEWFLPAFRDAGDWSEFKIMVKVRTKSPFYNVTRVQCMRAAPIHITWGLSQLESLEKFLGACCVTTTFLLRLLD